MIGFVWVTEMTSTLQRVLEAMREGASVIRRVGSHELSLCTVFLAENLESLTFVKEDPNLVSHLSLEGLQNLAAIEEAEAPGIAITVNGEEGEFRLQIIFPSGGTRDVWFAGLSVLTATQPHAACSHHHSKGEATSSSMEELVAENRKLRRLLQARDATIADLMAMVEGLIARQRNLMDEFEVEDHEENLRDELEEKIATLEEKKDRLEALLQASKEALEQQLE